MVVTAGRPGPTASRSPAAPAVAWPAATVEPAALLPVPGRTGATAARARAEPEARETRAPAAAVGEPTAAAAEGVWVPGDCPAPVAAEAAPAPGRPAQRSRPASAAATGR